MSIVLVDGFDLYNGPGANTGFQAKWVLNNTTSSLSLDTGRFGSGQSVKFDHPSGGTALYWLRALPSGYSAIAAGFAFKVTGISGVATDSHLFIGGEGGTPHVGLTLNANGSLTAKRLTSYTAAGTTLGSSAGGVIAEDTWHYIEIEITVHDSTGAFKVYVDGAQVINLTGIDTRNSGTGVINQVGMSGNSSSTVPNFWYDDFYVTDSAAKLGERRVETLRPNADVAQGFARSAGADNYALVDEAVANGDTDYVQGSTVGDVDTYGFGNLSTTPTAISAVQLTAFAMKTDAGSRSIALQAKSGATTSDGGNFALAAGYGKHERIMETDPDTSAAWTESGVNALEGGPKVTV